ncbi:class I SAM-dependent methyltransferase [Halorussus salinisoli]|uniref:class I SAM-dependent methyltransferase n=1 Tax=Halorussus salinisoli TaxID=2558242 RepID=UPI0010C1F9F0|nr:class I SAM-dependent methyltransferase [Halorussus salinisoli]
MGKFQNTALPDWDWWGKLWPTPGETLRELGVASGTTLVEVGCGNGYFALPAARITEPAPVYALELDTDALDELTHLAEQQRIDNVEPIRGDARELARHLPEPVDYVLIANTFHGVGDMTGFVQQAFDSLRPGGRLVVVNWHDLSRETTTIEGSPRGPPTDLRMTPEETENVVLAAAGFTLARQVELPPYHYALVFER